MTERSKAAVPRVHPRRLAMRILDLEDLGLLALEDCYGGEVQAFLDDSPLHQELDHWCRMFGEPFDLTLAALRLPEAARVRFREQLRSIEGPLRGAGFRAIRARALGLPED